MEDYIKRVKENNTIPEYMREVVCDEMYHGVEVSNLAILIAQEFGEEDKFCDDLSVAGILHDVGKLKLTKYLFSKEDDTLVIEQMKYVRMHSEYSYRILKSAGYDDDISKAVYYHHENFNGSGYPDKLRGRDIPWMSRILRACDVFAALTSNRSYRKAFDVESAVEIMIDEVADYDMKVFLAFQRILHNGKFKGIEQLSHTITPLQMKHLEMFEREALLD